jgi:hypothetical protein
MWTARADNERHQEQTVHVNRVSRAGPANILTNEKKSRVLLSWFIGTPYTGTQQKVPYHNVPHILQVKRTFYTGLMAITKMSIFSKYAPKVSTKFQSLIVISNNHT